MNSALAISVSMVFFVLGLWHFQMAFSAGSGESAAVPTVDGKPLFVPSAGATVAVGVALLLCAALVSGAAGILPLGVSPRFLAWPCYALALGLLARAIGEFRYLGFFKRVRGSRFARMDTLVYSPLCLLLSIGVGLVAAGHAA